MRRQVVCLVVALALVVLPACAGAGDADSPATTAEETDSPATTAEVTDSPATTAEEQDQEKELVIGFVTEPVSLDPHVPQDEHILPNVVEPLVRTGTDGQLQPLLAAELPAPIEETRWRVPLREDVSFHDGTPFDADVVVFNLERLLSLGPESNLAGRFEGVVGAEKVDQFTVDILTEAADSLLPARLEFLNMVPPGYVDDPAFAEQLIGTGPYKMIEWVRGASITVESNPDYWGEPPEIDRATFRFIGDYGTRLSSLLAGEIDIMQTLDYDDREAVPAVVVPSVADMMFIMLNTLDGLTADVRVRQAMALAIDREAIASQLYSGIATVPQGQILDESWFGSDPDAAADYGYDPDRARELLAEAGAEGATVGFLSAFGYHPKMEDVWSAIGSNWQDVGLVVEMDGRDRAAYIDVILGNVSPRPVATLIQGSQDFQDGGVWMEVWFNSESSRALVDDPEIQNLIEMNRFEIDQERRRDNVRQMADIVQAKAYGLPVVSVPTTVYGVSERLLWEPGQQQWVLLSLMDIRP